MIELKLLVDEVDYDSLAETLLPLVQDKLRDSGGMLGGMLSRPACLLYTYPSPRDI